MKKIYIVALVIIVALAVFSGHKAVALAVNQSGAGVNRENRTTTIAVRNGNPEAYDVTVYPSTKTEPPRMTKII